MENISIVIPTYNRSKILLKTLKALENQNYPKPNYEVIIADDGSTDDTSLQVENFQYKTDLKIRYFKLNHISSCHARNVAIINAKYELILSMDHDIIATPNFISEHIRYHKEYNFRKDIVVLGYIMWPPAWRVSSFMEYVIEKGPLYGYKLIKNELEVPFPCLYTANFSISKATLLENGMLDERFPKSFEDTELGYRLEKKGLKIILNKKAVAYHFHPITIFSFMKRQELAGFYAVAFYLKHPELKYFLLPSDYFKPFLEKIIKKIIYEIYNIFLRFKSKKLSIIYIKEKIYSILLSYSYDKGLNKGFSELYKASIK